MGNKPIRSQSLGERIRQMRQQQKLDLKQLAIRTGFPPEYLRDVVEGKVAPPVGTLIQISRSLSVDSSALLAEERKKQRLQSHLIQTAAYSYRCLTPDAQDKHLWAYSVTFEPEKQHQMAGYEHEGEEFVYVVEGKAEIQVEGNVHVLKKAASLHFNSGAPHKLKYPSPKQSKLIVVGYTP
jgi:quercetin dioxygenase-like cupin family protein